MPCGVIILSFAILTCSSASNVSLVAARDEIIISTCLTFVSGDVKIDGNSTINTALKTIVLPQLTYAGGSINISLNAALTTVDVNNLAHVAGALQFSFNSHLTHISMGSLSYVGQFFDIHVNTALAWLEVPLLSRVEQYFAVDNMLALTLLSLNALSFVGQYIAIFFDNALSTLTFPSLTFVGNSLSIETNSALTSVSAPLLTFIAQSLQVQDNVVLTTLSLPSITSITYRNVASLYFVALCSNSADFMFSEEIILAATGADCYLANLTSCPKTVCDIASSTDTSTKSTLATTSPCLIDVTYNSSSLNGILVAGSTDVACDDIAFALVLPPCTSASSINIISTMDIGIEALCLTYISGDLYVDGSLSVNDGLEIISLPKLTFVGGFFQVFNTHGGLGGENMALTVINIDHLAHVGQSFDVEDNSYMPWLGASVLTYIGAFFYLSADYHITSIDFHSLSYIGEYFGVHDLSSLTALVLPVLTMIGQYVLITQCAELTGVSFPFLAYIGLSISIQSNVLLSTLSMPSLVTVACLQGSCVNAPYAVDLCATTPQHSRTRRPLHRRRLASIATSRPVPAPISSHVPDFIGRYHDACFACGCCNEGSVYLLVYLETLFFVSITCASAVAGCRTLRCWR